MMTRSSRQYRETAVQVIGDMATEAMAMNEVMRILLEDTRNRELQTEERRQRNRAIAEEREQLREHMEFCRD